MSTVTKEEMISKLVGRRPHVFILGAGASRACCPNGDKNGKTLPLMNNFVDCLDLRKKLENWNIDPDQNFEIIFNDLYENNENEKVKEIEKIINDYFEPLRLPDTPTIYDYLVLSLQKKDLIATFNWDPLLLDAINRNGNQGFEMPQMAFLHGNVILGFCHEHKILSFKDRLCGKCHKPFQPSKLLYPVKKKNYANDLMIKLQWDQLQSYLDSAFQLTIFGYSAPQHDEEARSMLKKGWGNDRFKETEIINLGSFESIETSWEDFIFSHHCTISNTFDKSFIFGYPRRTFEAYWNQKMEANFTENFPIPDKLNFSELWEWYRKFEKAEKDYDKTSSTPKP